MERAVEHVSGTVTREHAAGAVGAVRAGRQAEDQQMRLGVAETWDGTAPIFPLAVGAPLHLGDVGTVLPKTRAEAAIDDLPLKQFEHRG